MQDRKLRVGDRVRPTRSGWSLGSPSRRGKVSVVTSSGVVDVLWTDGGISGGVFPGELELIDVVTALGELTG